MNYYSERFASEEQKNGLTNSPISDLYRVFRSFRLYKHNVDSFSIGSIYDESKQYINRYKRKISSKKYSKDFRILYVMLKDSLRRYSDQNKWFKYVDSTIFVEKNFRIIRLELDNSRKAITNYSSFHNDLSRIVSSSSFRRLQDKAQVFSLESYDFVRTRLTHSLEVSEIGEQISFKIQSSPIFKDSLLYDDKLPVIVRCASLLHDLGNPPFGHYGETIIRNVCFNIFNDSNEKISVSLHSSASSINKIIAEVITDTTMLNDFYYFDGNAQTFRIVNHLQTYDSKCSLNLTGSVLRSIIKYPFSSTETKEIGKFGYFYSEKDIKDFLEKKCDYQKGIVYLPAIIMECSDDIAYLISDIEDSFKKELIKYEDIATCDYKRAPRIVNKFISDFLLFYKRNKKVYSNPLEVTLQRVLNSLKINLISETAYLISNDKSKKRHLNRNYPFYHYVENTESFKICKFFRDKFIKPNVFGGRLISSDELEADKILSYLLKEYIRAVINTEFIVKGKFLIFKKKDHFDKYCKMLCLISPHLKTAYVNSKRNSDAEELYYRLKMVVDYVSGMTDSYAKNLYNKLIGTK